MTNTDKQTIKYNFSKYAKYYDQYCAVQDHCAAELASSIKCNEFKDILDLGCGTGNYTRLLNQRYPAADIKAVDISKQMINIAKLKICSNRVEFLVDDAECIDFDKRFDLISSNASFQWFDNLAKSVARYKTFLKPGGVIAFSIFGPKTYHELGSSLKHASFKHTNISSNEFVTKGGIRQILKTYFKKIQLTEKLYMKAYSSLTELLQNIKYTGTRGNGISKNLWTQRRIKSLEKIYRNRFGKITATYQVFYCRGTR